MVDITQSTLYNSTHYNGIHLALHRMAVLFRTVCRGHPQDGLIMAAEGI